MWGCGVCTQLQHNLCREQKLSKAAAWRAGTWRRIPQRPLADPPARPPTCGVHLEDIHPSVVDRRLQRLALLLLLECLPLSTQLIPGLEPVTHLRRQARGAAPGLPRAQHACLHACCGGLLLSLLLPCFCKAHLEARGQPLAAVHIINVAPLGVTQHLHQKQHSRRAAVGAQQP